MAWRGWVAGFGFWRRLGWLQAKVEREADRIDALQTATAAEDDRIVRLDAILARLRAEPPPDDAELDRLERELLEIDPAAWHDLQLARQVADPAVVEVPLRVEPPPRGDG